MQQGEEWDFRVQCSCPSITFPSAECKTVPTSEESIHLDMSHAMYDRIILFLTEKIKDFGGCLTSADFTIAINNRINQYGDVNNHS